MSLELTVQQFSGCEFTIKAFSKGKTGRDLKKTISGRKGFAVEQQLLMLPRTQTRLDDETPLHDVPSLGAATHEVVQLTLFSKMIPLRIVRPEDCSDDLLLKVFPCSSVLNLKRAIETYAKLPATDQTLSYNGVIMANDKLLIDYNLKDPEDGLNQSSLEEANATTTSRPFEIHLFCRKNPRGKLALGIDFSFNAIKEVRKVSWTPAAPSYREVTDGVSWFCYCRNARCPIANELFIVNKGTRDTIIA